MLKPHFTFHAKFRLLLLSDTFGLGFLLYTLFCGSIISVYAIQIKYIYTGGKTNIFVCVDEYLYIQILVFNVSNNYLSARYHVASKFIYFQKRHVHESKYCSCNNNNNNNGPNGCFNVADNLKSGRRIYGL